MDNQILEGRWKQLRGNFKEQWGKLTDDDLKESEGKRDKLIGKIQERYGVARSEAEQKFDEFVKKL